MKLVTIILRKLNSHICHVFHTYFDFHLQTLTTQIEAFQDFWSIRYAKIT